MRNKDGSITFGKPSRKWIQKDLRQSRTKKVIDMYVKMLLNGNIDYDKLGKLYRIDQKEPAWTIQRLLKQKEIKDMIDNKLNDVLIGEGVTQQYLIDKRKLIINLAQDNDKLDIMLKAIEGFEDMYAMRNNQKQITTTETYDFKKVLKEGESVQTEQLKATQETTKQVDEDKEKVDK